MKNSASAVICWHCGRPYTDHIRVTQPSMAPSLLACPTTFFEPRCPMCCQYACRCASVFTPMGQQPPP
jgi:hypothetical protein